MERGVKLQPTGMTFRLFLSHLTLPSVLTPTLHFIMKWHIIEEHSNKSRPLTYSAFPRVEIPSVSFLFCFQVKGCICGHPILCMLIWRNFPGGMWDVYILFIASWEIFTFRYSQLNQYNLSPSKLIMYV